MAKQTVETSESGVSVIGSQEAASVAKGDDGAVTVDQVKRQILAACAKPATPETAAEVKQLAVALHRLNGHTPGDLQKAIRRLYEDPKSDNAKEVAKQVEAAFPRL